MLGLSHRWRRLAGWLLLLSSATGVLIGSGACSDSAPSWPDGDPRTPYARGAFNFVVIGDWGHRGSANQRKVARRLGQVAARDSSRLVVSTGDNFYNEGVQSTQDPHWQRSFEDVYTAPSLQVPWHVVLGNHDHRGNVQAQVRYSQQSARWTMPARYYATEQQVDDTTRALFVFLDTTPLTRRSLSEEERADAQGDAAQQLRWLDSTLAATTADWRLVFGHHPLYSVGAGHQDDPVLIQNLQPLLERYGVQAYLSGHAHNLQHLRPEDSAVAYFVSGAGSSIRPVRPRPVSKAAVSVPGFLAVSLRPQRMEVQFVDFRGNVHYQTAVLQDQAPEARPDQPEAPAPTGGGDR